MTLYLHYGIYKAGSSYIQYLCVNQNKILKENGILFPQSSEDDKMKSGLISRGNDGNLTNALFNKNASSISNTLRKWLLSAISENCKAVLISAEALVHQIVVKDKIELLISEARNVGFTEIKMMGFFRDIADHALSTYKHRAKNGNLDNRKSWIKNNYETPYVLEALCNAISSHKDISWTLRKFKKDSNYLKKAFFKEWLGVELPDFKSLDKVNESLTISEIIVINYLKKYYFNVLDFFTDDLKALPKNCKASDKQLENLYFNDFVMHLNKFKSVLNRFNDYFLEDEKLIVGEMYSDNVSKTQNIVLSDNQLKTISDRVHFFNSSKGKYILLRRFIVTKILQKRNKSHFVYTK